MDTKRFILFIVNEKGAVTLKALIDSHMERNIGFVVSYKQALVQEDYYEAIKKMCNKAKIPCFERHEINNETIAFNLSKYDISGAITIGWQFLLPMEWFDSLEFKLIVFHDSLLPKYRGFSPTPTAIINGEQKVGITAIFATDEMDAGEIVEQRELELHPDEYIKDVIQRQANVFAEMVKEIIWKSEKDLLTSYPQDETGVTYSIWRDEKDCKINWTESSQAIYRLIRAVGSPYIGAYTYYNGAKIKIVKAVPVEDINFEIRYPGKIWKIESGNPIIMCGSGMIKILEAEDSSGNKVIFKKLRSRME